MKKSDRDTYKEMYLIPENQFGFMTGRSMKKAIHFMRRMMDYIGLEKETFT